MKNHREDGAQYAAPSCSEIAGLIIGDIGQADHQQDIVVERKIEGLIEMD